jgi:hypothetical protein
VSISLPLLVTIVFELSFFPYFHLTVVVVFAATILELRQAIEKECQIAVIHQILSRQRLAAVIVAMVVLSFFILSASSSS